MLPANPRADEVLSFLVFEELSNVSKNKLTKLSQDDLPELIPNGSNTELSQLEKEDISQKEEKSKGYGNWYKTN